MTVSKDVTLKVKLTGDEEVDAKLLGIAAAADRAARKIKASNEGSGKSVGLLERHVDSLGKTSDRTASRLLKVAKLGASGTSSVLKAVGTVGKFGAIAGGIGVAGGAAGIVGVAGSAIAGASGLAAGAFEAVNFAAKHGSEAAKGAMKQMTDLEGAAKGALTTLGTALAPAVSAIASALSKALPALETALKPLGPELAKTMGPFATALAKLVPEFATILVKMAPSMMKLATASLPLVGDVAKGLGAAMTFLFNEVLKIGQWFSKNKKTIGDVFKTAVGDAKDFYKALKPILEVSFSVLKGAFNDIKSVVEWFGKHKDEAEALAIGVGAVAIALFGVAAAEGAVALATAALSLVLDAIGIGEIIILVSLLALGIIELVKHFGAVKHAVSVAFDAVKHAVSDAIGFIRDHWKLILSILTGPPGAAVIYIISHFQQIVTFIKSIPGKIASVAKTMWDGMKHAAGNAADWIWSKMKWLVNQIVSFFKSIPSRIGHLGSSILHDVTSGLGHAITSILPNQGGVVHKYMGGPVGTDSVPAMLTPGEGVLSRAAMQQIGQAGLTRLNMGMGGGGEEINIRINPGTTVVKIGARELAEAVTQYALERAARGPSSLIGGALATNVSGVA